MVGIIARVVKGCWRWWLAGVDRKRVVETDLQCSELGPLPPFDLPVHVTGFQGFPPFMYLKEGQA